ncbi:MAG: GNAT family N-acetyltransferase [Thermodesulfobacteriota bacterium]
MHEISLSPPDLEALAEQVLGRGGVLWFRAYGFSMHPFLKNGDLVMLRPTDPSSLSVGTIVLCRCATGLMAHRIVRMGIDPHEGTQSVLVRGDAPTCPETVVSLSDILGEVSAVRHGDNVVRLDRGFRKVLGGLIARDRSLAEWLVDPRRRIRLLAAPLVRRIRDLPAYRSFVKRFLVPAIEYMVATGEADPMRVPERSTRRGLRNWDRQESKMDKCLGSEYLVVHALLHGRTVGSVEVLPSLDRGSEDRWLFSLQAHPLLRRVGIGETLVQMGIQKSLELGARTVSALVNATNEPSLELFKKLGFVETVVPGMETTLQLHRGSDGEASIIMSKTLCEKGSGLVS